MIVLDFFLTHLKLYPSDGQCTALCVRREPNVQAQKNWVTHIAGYNWIINWTSVAPFLPHLCSFTSTNCQTLTNVGTNCFVLFFCLWMLLTTLSYVSMYVVPVTSLCLCLLTSFAWGTSSAANTHCRPVTMVCSPLHHLAF